MTISTTTFRSLFFILTSTALLSLFSGCSGKKTAGDDDEESVSTVQALVSVETTPVIKTDIASTIEVTGKVDAVRKQRILSPVNGVLLSFPKLEGETVSAGTVLAEIRTKESQSAISGAEAILRNSTTDEQRAQAKHDLELANSTQTALKIKAGFDGVLSNRLAGPGELVQENTELITLVDLSSLFFSADIPVSLLQNIHAGQVCAIRFPSASGISIYGTVESISAQSDAQSQTVKARIRFGSMNPTERNLLKTDLPGIVEVTTSVHKGVLAVPRNAVIRDDEKKSFEIVCVRDSLALRMPVTVGVQNDSLIEISASGLQPGLKVVTTGASTLPDSTHVRLEPIAE